MIAHFSSFYYVHVTRKSCRNDVRTKNARVLCWWNWRQVKKRRRQKTERQKVEDSLLDENSEQLGFGSISSENMHGPGYTTFEQNPDRIENRSSKSSKNNFCSNLFVFVISLTALVVVMLRWWFKSSNKIFCIVYNSIFSDYYFNIKINMCLV